MLVWLTTFNLDEIDTSFFSPLSDSDKWYLETLSPKTEIWGAENNFIVALQLTGIKNLWDLSKKSE